MHGAAHGPRPARALDRIVLIGTPYSTTNYPDGTTELFSTLTPDALEGMVTAEFNEVVAKARALYDSDETWQAFWAKLVNGLWTRAPGMTLTDPEGVGSPTLVLHAANEGFYDVKDSEDMARTIPNGQLTIIPDATHTSPQENPAAVNQAIVHFLVG